MFCLTVWDLLVLRSQSMIIRNQPRSAPVGSCQKFPWHGTHKNVIRENGPLFQHRHFLHEKFLVNDEFLQIHVGTDISSKRRRLRSIATYHRFYIVSENHLGDFAQNKLYSYRTMRSCMMRQ